MEFKHLNSLLSGSSICIRFGILNLVCMLPSVWLELSKSEATGESGIFSFGGRGGGGGNNVKSNMEYILTNNYRGF